MGRLKGGEEGEGKQVKDRERMRRQQTLPRVLDEHRSVIGFLWTFPECAQK